MIDTSSQKMAMRRYLFGGTAALIALCFLAVVAVLGVLALTSDYGDLLWRVVARDPGFGWMIGPEDGTVPVPWWLVLVLVFIGALQAWALWQVFRGRVRGELTERGRRVGLLRLALYLSAGNSLVAIVTIQLLYIWHVSWPWVTLGIAGGCVQVAIVWLYFVVLRETVSRGLRLFSLVTGTVAAVSGVGYEITELFGLHSASKVLILAGGYGHIWLLWVVAILIAQARDPRWSAATVWVGVTAQVIGFLQPSGMVTSLGGFPYLIVVYSLLGAANVFGLVWEARSAHELARPLPEPGALRAPARQAARWWPVAVTAVALPLVPAAVNLADGRYLWIGPRGVIEQFVRAEGGTGQAVTWLALDVFVGVGGPALLILAAVLRRTRRAVLFTTLTLVIASAVGFVSALTATPLTDEFGVYYDGTQIYPDDVFADSRDGEVYLGISPAWHAAALLASAALLAMFHPISLARRTRRRVLLLAQVAVLLTLVLVPVADLAQGPVTTAADCAPKERWTGEPEEPRLTKEQRLVCSLRDSGVLKLAATTPDSMVLTHARWLCGVYTRNDPQEAAILTARGLTRDALVYPLADICPSAGAVVAAAAAEEEREMQEWEADAQRMCDESPRHRPLIKPAKTVRLREPQWTDYGVVEAYEPTDDSADPFEDGLLEKAQDNGLAAALPGHLMVITHSDYDLCVTLETYSRRPPVETKGWDHVVEVGYLSPTGVIVLEDSLSGTTFPDLSLNGRAGNYRIRVHYDWFDWKGPSGNGQRLLIMAFPGKGPTSVTYRKPRS